MIRTALPSTASPVFSSAPTLLALPCFGMILCMVVVPSMTSKNSATGLHHPVAFFIGSRRRLRAPLLPFFNNILGPGVGVSPRLTAELDHDTIRTQDRFHALVAIRTTA